MSLSYIDFKNFPDMAVDIETRDPNLKIKGNGVFRRDGFILGVAFSIGEISEYYPLHHVDTSSEERTKNLKYITDQLSGTNDKIFANGLYDLDWLINFEGIPVNGKYQDVQIAEPLIDEYKKSYSLDNLAKEYLGKSKNNKGIIDFCLRRGFINSGKGNIFKVLHKVPSDIVGEYSAEDAKLTFEVHKKQEPILKENSLFDIYNLEMSIFPLLLKMRKNGVRIDEKALEKTKIFVLDSKEKAQKRLNSFFGGEINPNSNLDLQKLFFDHDLEITYGPPTKIMVEKGRLKGNPVFNKSELKKTNHEIANEVLKFRHFATLQSLFIEPYENMLVSGKLHANFSPLRGDDYGTVSGRFSSSNPNLQQVSAKSEDSDDDITGLIIRKLFIPEENHQWLKFDWSQIEYRILAHYAQGPGSDVIRDRYNSSPDVDYHHELGIMTGISDRKTVKNLNFGGVYGQGFTAMSKLYGWDIDEAESIYKLYHEKVPFVKYTAHKIAEKAKATGYVKTILGRRAHLPDPQKGYIMINRLIQGSAADLMKKAMAMAFEKGVFDILIPHITVHDELDCSMPKTKEGISAAKELKHIMETCIKLRVPIIAECEIGESWGDLKKIKNLDDYDGL